ncbi:PAS domain-containing protein [Halorubrum sp. BOL3-1]|uniref:ATP-binding protein n=1 Tax=Halorubrum sp. BOL3-1 TaxID=2497325 RepID=UPI001004E0DD|nr:ATP-binding protein [Halorubrum sp. BOL3-1]QAU14115.1 PAS domain-containing protein [Halorubrum sp. BOL3-1]
MPSPVRSPLSFAGETVTTYTLLHQNVSARMVSLPLDALSTGVTFLSGVVVAGLAVRLTVASRNESDSRQPDLLLPFLLTVTLFSLPLVSFPLYESAITNGAHSLLTLFLGMVVLVPWAVFALRYAGRDHLLNLRRVVAAAVYIGVLTLVFVGNVMEALDLPELATGAIGMGFLLVTAVAFAVVGAVLLSTYRYAGIPMGQSIAVVLPIVALMTAAQTLESGLLVRKLVNASVFLLGAGGFWAAVTRYDALRRRPGTGRIGVRAAISNMNEPVLVADTDGRITKANEAATTLFGQAVTGRQAVDILDRNVSDLSNRGIFDCRTNEGYRRFDPRTSTVTGGTGQRLGTTVTLIDVTEKELRSQRIQVLNRILRHNIRNELSAIKARVDLATDTAHDTTEQLNRITAVADELEELSSNARQVEKLVGDRDSNRTTRSLEEFAQSVVTDAVPADIPADLTVSVPSVDISLDWELLGYALRNVVENAVEHNDAETACVEVTGESTALGVRLTVADNGPGIPEHEAAVVRSGSESKLKHATSFGLWGASWAVQSLGGKLTIDESQLGGAAVSMEFPTRDD